MVLFLREKKRIQIFNRIVQVEGPGGHQVHSSKAKTEDKFDFIAHRKGMYKFCFFNRNSMHETVDFDVHIGFHIINPNEEHVKDGECTGQGSIF